MEARVLRFALLAAAIGSLGASHRSPNFVVTAPSAQLAREIGEAAEQYRRQLAIEWLGREMPAWSQPCPITAQVADHLGAGGATSFLFERGEVFGWQMTIQGSRVRILDSVLPHEVTHTIFATHFRQPLPRWADEGACTTVEHQSERAKQQTMLVDFLRTGRGIPFARMFAMREYPHDVMPLYSQGYSLARYLVAQGGKHKFLAYLADGMRDENWPRATKAHYGFSTLSQLQTTWLAWVRQGSPPLDNKSHVEEGIAQLDRQPRPESNLIYRGQSPDATGQMLASIEPSRSGGQIDDSYERAPGQPGRWGWKPRGSSAKSAASIEPAKHASDAKDSPADGPAHQVTRPQPAERPRQVVLEWSREPQTIAGEQQASVYSRALAN